MLEIIETEDNRWDNIVTSFKNYDVYYLKGYLLPFCIHGDGIPQLLYYENNGLRGICAVLKRAIQDTGLFDVTTPYGYGGFIWEGDITDDNIRIFTNIFHCKMVENNIVSGFFRYHPILENANAVRSSLPVTDLGETIDISLESEEIIFANFTSQNRNKIRKAIKNDVTVSSGKGKELFDKFIPIYYATMDRDNASTYYYFSREFFEAIDTRLKDNYRIFYACHEDKIISASLILYANKFIHYHLSGSLAEYRSLAPTNLLLYEAAKWGSRNGFTRFHLGGGLGSKDDRLLDFKRSFNRNSSNRFSIGKMIFDMDNYNKLIADRVKYNPDFDIEASFFPLYRA
ncbi:MAG: GNAT family N-acetyltransferase [Rikenellaceae bacterium]|nr:GNAT family N-acetyltransferase [Rikenellaceae bacterium]